MALVSGGGGSTLNPNAPLYIPACMRQVEDFLPEWWDLVTTSTWFRDYWFSQNQVEDFSSNDEDDISDLLPDSIDIGLDEDLLSLESQLEEFFKSSEAEKGNMAYFSAAAKNLPRNDDVDALVKSLMFSRGCRGPRFGAEPIKHSEKQPGKRVSPKCSPRCIQQPG